MSDVEIGNAIIAGIADGDTVLEKMSEIIDHLRLAGFEIVPVGGGHAQGLLIPTPERIEPILDDFLGVDSPHYEELRKRCAQRIFELYAVMSRACFSVEEIRIDALRRLEAHDGSQGDLAREIGVSPAYLSMLLNDACRSGPKILKALGYETEPRYAKKASALTSTPGQAIEKTEGGASTYCAHCDHEHKLHEDAHGFHHVIKGRRVACCSVPSTHRGDT